MRIKRSRSWIRMILRSSALTVARLRFVVSPERRRRCQQPLHLLTRAIGQNTLRRRLFVSTPVALAVLSIFSTEDRFRFHRLARSGHLTRRPLGWLCRVHGQYKSMRESPPSCG